ncbi:hypothetical protein TorRG33x02_353290 [Trema orientale]|uniref:Uncharacterized protein n=1 Tax=Trema orientale TaxID=63057 RepID=A0A2P5AD28_TREOI|nr:hypothetical protein TorRG33x02_353290 [Trema orientale]
MLQVQPTHKPNNNSPRRQIHPTRMDINLLGRWPRSSSTTPRPRLHPHSTAGPTKPPSHSPPPSSAPHSVSPPASSEPSGSSPPTLPPSSPPAPSRPPTTHATSA